MKTFNRSINKQKGAALLLVIMILFAGFSSMLLASMNNQNYSLKSKIETRRETQDRLVAAKEILLAFSRLFPDSSGITNRLPCPDNDTNDNYPDPTCNTTVATFQGRLPEELNPAGGDNFTFDRISDFYEQLWYAIDPNFHLSSVTTINTVTPATGAFSIDGVGDYVAVIIAPGEEEVDSQDRIGAPDNADNFLEGGNENGTTYVSRYSADPNNFNDQVIGITRSELITPIANRVAEKIKNNLTSYYNVDRYYRDAQPSDYWSCYAQYPKGKSYPRDFTYNNQSYPDAAGKNGVVCLWHTEDEMFEIAMLGDVWYTTDGWNPITTYTNISNTEATVEFDNCNIRYRYKYVSGETVLSYELKTGSGAISC
ncbi:MAG: hypothetical protein COA71_09865 [SAR86 cluster bacterium]|uniref:Type II secretion system protein n=1 Tax=SAR86 cluster bacterium TaxID=2030880 RepID=A0A2A5CAP0_9GAMM|nr:MAG: hypothetical protein COA71_09865 [SAR86 cluster bacterium]